MERGAASAGVGDDFSCIDVHGAGGESGNFRLAVKTHEDSAASAVHFAESIGEPSDAERIEARGGLVEEQHRGAMNERTGDGDALAHAAGESADQGVATLEEADFTKQIFGASGGIVDLLKFGEEHEIFFGGEFIVDHGGVPDIAGASIGSVGSGAGKRQLAGCRQNNLRSDAQKGGLAGAVASCKDEAFARSDFQGDVAKSVEAAITLIDVVKAKAGWR